MMALPHLLLITAPSSCSPGQAQELPASCVSSCGCHTPPEPVLWPGQLRTTVVRGNLFLTPCREMIFLPWGMKTEVLIIFITASQSAEAILIHINV